MEHVIREADALIRRYRTRDPFEIASLLNITIKYGEFDKLLGFYRCVIRNRFIVINAKLCEIERAIICAHELGHDRLHRGRATDIFMRDSQLFSSAGTLEYEANVFAAQLLIPDSSFLEHAMLEYTVAQIAACLNVHEELARIKCTILSRQGHKLHLLDMPTSTYLKKKLPSLEQSSWLTS